MQEHSQTLNLPRIHFYTDLPIEAIRSLCEPLKITPLHLTPQREETQENALNGVELTNSDRFPEIEEELFGESFWIFDFVRRKKLGGGER